MRVLLQKLINSSDSTDIVERYVQSWIKKQLLIDEASSRIDFDEAEISRKILDYRYALMVHEFKQFHINEQLQKEVTEEEIQSYYVANQANFELKQNIIRGIFIKLPKEAPKINTVGKMIRSQNRRIKMNLLPIAFSLPLTTHWRIRVWLNLMN